MTLLTVSSFNCLMLLVHSVSVIGIILGIPFKDDLQCHTKGQKESCSIFRQSNKLDYEWKPKNSRFRSNKPLHGYSISARKYSRPQQRIRPTRAKMNHGHPPPFTFIRAENPIRIPSVKRKSTEYFLQHTLIGKCNSSPSPYKNIVSCPGGLQIPYKDLQPSSVSLSATKKYVSDHTVDPHNNIRKTSVFSREEDYKNNNIINVKKNSDLDRKRNIIQINKLDPILPTDNDNGRYVSNTNVFLTSSDRFNITSFIPNKESIVRVELDNSENEITGETTLEIEE